MKVILQKDVSNLGDAGDIKEVSDGYARNFLFPKKFAIRADEGNTKTAIHQKKMALLKKEKRKKTMSDLASSINGKEFELKVKVGEKDKLFGSVTANDISVMLKNSGFDIDKRKIELSDQIKSLGEFSAKIKLADGINASVKIKVDKEV
ncbi:MAG: 50S ribosomal protein L9 [Leptospiraceae bacterium]|nr:50S ribosomal protein L9 [Leptospiraceae bacterium]MCK6380876.1 50S ribosomal protein L9 [Leptospiraceae bacterium]NUM41282.1 50S ribosomal protein L9 [Leptospiraceae bacterium]